MKDLKFRVKNPEHSKAIQERLFELGYYWEEGDTSIIKNANHIFLSVSEDKIKYFFSSDNHFNSLKSAEVTLDDLYNDDFLKEEDPFGFLEEFNNLIKEGEELIKKYKK